MGQRYVRKHIVDYQKQQLYNMADISRHEHQLYCYRYVAVGSCLHQTRRNENIYYADYMQYFCM
nr:MAG TPA: hypothetical protein [Caudoviricetes sp.]